jgi:hypothetical protein
MCDVNRLWLVGTAQSKRRALLLLQHMGQIGARVTRDADAASQTLLLLSWSVLSEEQIYTM